MGFVKYLLEDGEGSPPSFAPEGVRSLQPAVPPAATGGSLPPSLRSRVTPFASWSKVGLQMARFARRVGLSGDN